MNGQPGALIRDRDGRVFSAMTLDIVDGQIQTIRSGGNRGWLSPGCSGWTSRETGSSAFPDGECPQSGLPCSHE